MNYVKKSVIAIWTKGALWGPRNSDYGVYGFGLYVDIDVLKSFDERGVIDGSIVAWI